MTRTRRCWEARGRRRVVVWQQRWLFGVDGLSIVRIALTARHRGRMTGLQDSIDGHGRMLVADGRD